MRAARVAVGVAAALLILPSAASAASYSSPGGDLVLHAQRGSVELLRDGAVVASDAPGASWQIQGADGVADTLRVENPDGGVLPAHVTFTGGDGAGVDSLELVGGHADSGGATATGPGSGSFVHRSGADTLTVDYSGLEPTTDTVPQSSYTVTYGPGDDAITIDNGATDGDGIIRVDTPTTESIDFANKTNVTIDGGGGNDTVAIDNSDAPSGLLGTMTVMTAAHPSTSTIVGAANYGSATLMLNTSGGVADTNGPATNVLAARLGIDAVGKITLDTNVGLGGNIEADSVNGPIDIENLGDVTIGGVSASLHGLHVAGGGGVRFATAGSLTLDDATGPEAVSSDVDGDVELTATRGIATTAGQDAARAPSGAVTLDAQSFAIAPGSEIVADRFVSFVSSFAIDVGGTGALAALSDAELDEVTAPILEIQGAGLTVSAPVSIDPAKAPRLRLLAASGGIDQFAPLTAHALQAIALHGVVGLTDAGNDVDALDGSGETFLYRDSDGLTLDLPVVATRHGVDVSSDGDLEVNDKVVAHNQLVNLTVWGAGGLLDNDSQVESGGATLRADRMDLADGKVYVGAGQASLFPTDPERTIKLGPASDSGNALELSDAELDTIPDAAGIAVATDGVLTVTQPITVKPKALVLEGRVINGPGSVAASSVELDASSHADRKTWTIGPKAVSDTGHTPLGYSTPLLRVRGSDLVDTFKVLASRTTRIVLFGGNPNGDSLFYGNGGHRTGGDATPPNGHITARGFKPVDFYDIERVKLTGR
jgi:hypothetical protein